MNRVLPPAYWHLWRATATGNLADGVLRAALPLVALRFTDAPVTIAAVTTVASAPFLLVLLVGVLVDRHDRRVLLSLSGLARCGMLAVSVAVLSAEVEASLKLVLVFAVALVTGVGETFAESSVGALVPAVSPRDQLPRANGRLHAAQLVANEFAGPSLAGLLIGSGLVVALGMPAVGYALAGFFALRLPGQPKAVTDASAGWWSELREGASFVARNPSLRRLVGVTGAWNVASGLAFSVLVLFAVAPGPLELSEPAYGLLLAATGVGGLLGSLATERLRARLSFRGLVVLGAGAGGMMLSAPAFSDSVWVVASALAFGGFAAVAVGVAIVSMRQRLTPDRMLGRVNAAFWTASAGLYPLGALLGGLIAEHVDIRASFLAAGLTAGIGVAFGLRLPRDPGSDQAEGVEVEVPA